MISASKAEVKATPKAISITTTPFGKEIILDMNIYYFSVLPQGYLAIIPPIGSSFFRVFDYTWNYGDAKYPEEVNGFNLEKHGLQYHISKGYITVFDPIRFNFNFRIKKDNIHHFIVKPTMLNEEEFACFYDSITEEKLHVYDFTKMVTLPESEKFLPVEKPIVDLGKYSVAQSNITRITNDTFAVTTPSEIHFFKKVKGSYQKSYEFKQTSPFLEANLVAVTKKKIINFVKYQVEEKSDFKGVPRTKFRYQCQLQILEADDGKDSWSLKGVFKLRYVPSNLEMFFKAGLIVGTTKDSSELWAWDLIQNKEKIMTMKENFPGKLQTIAFLDNGQMVFAAKDAANKLVIVDTKELQLCPVRDLGVFGAARVSKASLEFQTQESAEAEKKNAKNIV